MQYKKYIKFIISVFFTVGLSYSLVFAWTNISNMSSGAVLSETAINNIIDKINENGNKLSNIDTSGSLIPEGFSKTNGVIHSELMPLAIHLDAANLCAARTSHICNKVEYQRAQLGWYDNSSPTADDHLFWDGSISWNVVTSCVNVSCSVGATVEAGSHDGNSYVAFDYTPCANRCTRALQYYCCKN